MYDPAIQHSDSSLFFPGKSLPVGERKKKLRSQIRTRRKKTPQPNPQDHKVIEHLLSFLTPFLDTQGSSPGVSRIAAYVPMPGEPGGEKLIPSLLSVLTPQDSLLLPRVIAGTSSLEWVSYSQQNPPELQPGTFNILEPQGVADKQGIAHCKLIILPALAIDHHGRRLGQGGGFYDRLFPPSSALTPQSSSPTLCALVYEEEFLKTLPTEEHDLRVHRVITEKGIYELQ